MTTNKTFKAIKYFPAFKKDFKKLSKRFHTLQDDLDVFIRTQLKLTHILGLDNQGIFRIPDLGDAPVSVYKARKFACKSLKGKGARSGIRIIYSHHIETDTIEFIEIYYKGDKAAENRKRIMKYLENP